MPWASNILFPPLPFRLFSNLFSVTMLALLLRISSKIAQKCRCKIAELILSTLLNHPSYTHIIIPFRGQCNLNLLHLHPKGYNYIFSAMPKRLLILRRSTITPFAAKHCSSLCLQSEGDDFMANTPQRSGRIYSEPIATFSILATCPWPSLCEQSELQCFAPRNSLIRVIRCYAV